MKFILRTFKFFFAAFLITISIKIWFDNLDESKQRFVKNILRQIPELPGRYSI